MKLEQRGIVAWQAVLAVGAVIVLGLAGWFWYQMTQNEEESGAVEHISSFEECVAAGYPVMESQPRQCRTPEGELFVEEAEFPADSGEEESPEEYTSDKGETVVMEAPLANDNISSPLKISGEVRGTWSFEADFPIELRNEEGQVFAQTIGTVIGDWMTEDYVPFKATLEFTVPDGVNQGFLVLIKDNPSGLPENDDFVSIPVRFRD